MIISDALFWNFSNIDCYQNFGCSVKCGAVLASFAVLRNAWLRCLFSTRTGSTELLWIIHIGLVRLQQRLLSLIRKTVRVVFNNGIRRAELVTAKH